MYILQDQPTQYKYKDHEELLTPDATLINENGSVFHIDQDDNCYVLVQIDSETKSGVWQHHWFPEAVEALKTLPPLDPNKGWLVNSRVPPQITQIDPDIENMLDNITCYLMQIMETNKE